MPPMRMNREIVVAVAWAAVLVLSSSAALGLLALRVERTGSWQWSFLVVNLALSWIPFCFAIVVFLLARFHAPKWCLLAPAAAWLAFMPNAPYIWTDLMHLSGHDRPMFVTDLILISTFAMAGLLAGYASLYLIHASFERTFGRVAGWLLVVGVLPLVSVGIYLGRVFRWNSWEAMDRVDDLVALAAMRIADPLGNPFLIAACLLMTVCLAIGYAIVFALTRVALNHSNASRRTTPG